MSGNTAYVLVHLDQESGYSDVIAVSTSPTVGEAWKLQCSHQETSCEDEDGGHRLLPLCFVEEMPISDEMSIDAAQSIWWNRRRAMVAGGR